MDETSQQLLDLAKTILENERYLTDWVSVGENTLLLGENAFS